MTDQPEEFIASPPGSPIPTRLPVPGLPGLEDLADLVPGGEYPVPDHDLVDPNWVVLYQRPFIEGQQAAEVWLLHADASAAYRRFQVGTDSSGYPVTVWNDWTGWTSVLRVTADEVTDSVGAAEVAFTILNGGNGT